MHAILTLVANREATTLSPAVLNRVRDAVRGAMPVVLSDGEAADIPVAAAPNMDDVYAALEGAAIDAIVVRPRGRRKGLLIADMDSTIITAETLDELAAIAGIGEKIAAITARAMNGELDFKEALRERVGMLKGLSTDALDQTWQRIRLTPGAKELVATMRAHGALTALVSGGFTFFTGRVAETLGFDLHRSNELLHADGALLGAVREPIPPLLAIAKQAGFTQQTFEECINDSALLNKVQQMRDRGSTKFKVDSTPTFFINGERHSGAMSIEELDKIIQALIKS